MLQKITRYMTLVVTSNIWVLCVAKILGQTKRSTYRKYKCSFNDLTLVTEYNFISMIVMYYIGMLVI